MERWEIRPSPNADDPLRHLLLMRGGVADVAAVLKKFGALCGRPTPLEGEEFNLSFVLHKVTPEVNEKLREWLGKMSPKPAPTPVSPPAPVPMPTPAPALIPVLTPAPAAAAPSIPSIPDMPSLSPMIPPPSPAPAGVPFGIPSASTLPPPNPILPPIPMPPETKQPLISLGPEAAVTPLAPAPIPPTELRMATPVAAAPVVEPPIASPPAVVSGAVLDAASELRTDWTFETLLVGAYNRFSHAAAMSVVSSPGSMYNPLFLYGVPGTGKSHLLYSIAGSMSKGLGTASLLMTSGARLSRAVSAAVANGSMAAIDKKVSTSTALFVDDIHLLSVTDKNKDVLAKIFKSFFDRGLQVVITSMYPPKALGTLEEALKFSFSKGWSVDLKIPSPNVQRDLISSVNDRVGAQLNGDEIGQIADKLVMWGYPELTLWMSRIALLRKMRASAGQPAPLMDILRLIYEPITIGSEAPPVSTAGATFTPPAAPPGSPTLAVMVPKGQEGLGAYAVNLFQDTGAKNGFSRVYSYALMDTYDAMQPVGVPFQIAERCQRAGVTRVLLVGPGPDSPLAPRSNEFGHAVRHILDSAGVATGWIPHPQLHIMAHYVNAHLDFEK